jgi:RNA polymerase sigma factor (sigma-70 family)
MFEEYDGCMAKVMWKKHFHSMNKAKNLGYSQEDLEGMCQLGVAKARVRFDLSRGNKFMTYAMWWMWHEVTEACRLPLKKLRQMGSVANSYSGDSYITGGRDPDMTVFDTITTGEESQVEIVLRAERAEAVRKALEQIPALPRDREILMRRFGLDGNGGTTLREAGEEYGLSRARVEQIVNRCLRSLGDRLSALA